MTVAEIEVRAASNDNLDDLTELVQVLHRHYGRHEGLARETLWAELAANGPAGNGLYDCLIAYRDGAPVGLAMFSRVWDPGLLAVGWYIRDVYVRPEARRQGVARKLFIAIARAARERGIVRLDWHTDATNAPAVALYDSFRGARRNRVAYRLIGDDIGTLADGA